MPEAVSYAANLKRIQQITSELQSCDDVQLAMEQYDLATTLLAECTNIIDEAKGRLDVVRSSGEEMKTLPPDPANLARPRRPQSLQTLARQQETYPRR